MKRYAESWRTTVAGLVVIGFGVMLFTRSNDQAVQTAAGALVVAGIGLVRAKDA